MICLHCGYCCIYLDVIILKDYDKAPSEENALHKHSNEVCPHLAIKNNKIICLAHDKIYYKDCPCDQHSQFESTNSFCRIGNHLINELKAKKLCDQINQMNIPVIS